jgi:hypothetical protein
VTPRPEDEVLNRCYQMRWTRPIMRCMYVFWTAVAAVFVLGTTHDRGAFSPLIALLSIAVLGAFINWGETTIVKTGLVESDAGLRYRHSFGSRFVPWESIVRFEHRQITNKKVIVAILQDGRARSFDVILEGQRVIWRGGETRNLTAVLNDRLCAARRYAAAPATSTASRKGL